MILMVKQAVGDFIVFKLLKVSWIINAMLWNFIECSSDEVIQNSFRNCICNCDWWDKISINMESRSCCLSCLFCNI